MATNRVHADGTQLSLAATDPATPAVGDPVVVGQLPGVALTDERPDGTTTIQTDGVFDLPVTAGAGGIAAGDIVNYATGTDTVGSAAGVRFGYALAAVAASSTATIPVKIGY